MNKIISHIVLPKEVSPFEETYLKRINTIAQWFFAAHLPVFMLVAWANDTGPFVALALTTMVLVPVFLSSRVFDSPRSVSLTMGFSAMMMGGLLVHFGQGPVQIEMHFYFFALLAMLSIFGNPMVIAVAALTAAAHHALLWAYLPASIFNYDAPFWVVAVHAGFVVLESVAASFISRNFFDNVIGLDKIIQQRTSELKTRNEEMKLVMDHVDQGFITVDIDGVLSTERSRAVEDFFGDLPEGTRFQDVLLRINERVGLHYELCWEQLVDGFLPPEMALDQLPKKFESGERSFEMSFTPIIAGGTLERVLIVVSDVTAAIERSRLEAEQAEIMNVFERVMKDKAGFLEFFEEANDHVKDIVKDRIQDEAVLKRVLHTVKGNSMLFGINTVGELCHKMEDSIELTGERPNVASRKELHIRWEHIKQNLETVLGEGGARIEIEDEEFEHVLKEILSPGVSRERIADRVKTWKLERAEVRLGRIADQAKSIAKRLNKPDLEVEIDDGDVRLDPGYWAPFWSSFVHVVRNAVDHGIEDENERQAAGKPQAGKLKLMTRTDAEGLIVSLADDGKGIDWERVANKAQSLGIPANDQNDLVEALFSEGMSTRDEVTSYSGRGVGMGAVREACKQRQGQVKVVSEKGQGTVFEFRFPRDQMQQVRQASLPPPSTIDVA